MQRADYERRLRLCSPEDFVVDQPRAANSGGDQDDGGIFDFGKLGKRV